MGLPTSRGEGVNSDNGGGRQFYGEDKRVPTVGGDGGDVNDDGGDMCLVEKGNEGHVAEVKK